MKLLRWDAPGPYKVAFSTRLGGVSEGPFESLNLTYGARWWPARDARDRVDENRRRLCEAVGGDDTRLAVNVQTHSPRVNRATPGLRGVAGDGLWADEAALPLLALGADCLPVALVRANGARPAVAVLHAGRMGVLGGILEAGVEALGGRVAAAIGPGIGPCCYEVGESVGAPYRQRFGPGVLRGSHLDLPRAAEQTLHEAGCTSVERFDLCTACNADLFFSYRRDGTPRGAQGVVAYVA
jgi:YfiH family protein